MYNWSQRKLVPKIRNYNNALILTGKCIDCHKIKPIEEFDIASKSNFSIYYRPRCHNCFLVYRTNYRKINNHQNKKYRTENKQKIREYNKKFYEEHKDLYKIWNKENSKRYKTEGRWQEYFKRFREKNKEDINKTARDNSRKLRKTNLHFKLKTDISRSIRRYLKQNGSRKNGNLLKYLSFTIEELKKHLENNFLEWMNWNNHGKYNSKTWDDNDTSTWVWNIDHIIPQSILKYYSMEDENFKICWSLKNLRPLSAKQNIQDGNRRNLN